MIIETEHLTKKYPKKLAVDSVDLAVERGQVYGFLGPNGAGKSTCIKMLLGLVFPSSGKGQVLGKPLGNVEARRKLGYLPELFRYQEWMTGEDLLNFHASLFRLGRDSGRNARILKRVGLLGQERYKVGSYSRGMQQRIGLACALLPDPELLFLDEPTSALDPVGRKEVRDIIVGLQKEGTTVFLNSHLLSEVETVCDHVTIIRKGSVVKSGSMEQLLLTKISLRVECSPVPQELFTFVKEHFDPELAPQTPDGLLLFSLRNREDIGAIATALVSGNVTLYALTPEHQTLETVFLNAVKEGDAI